MKKLTVILVVTIGFAKSAKGMRNKNMLTEREKEILQKSRSNLRIHYEDISFLISTIQQLREEVDVLHAVPSERPNHTATAEAER